MQVMRTPGTLDWGMQTPRRSDSPSPWLGERKGQADDLKSEFQKLFTPSLFASMHGTTPLIGEDPSLQEVPSFGMRMNRIDSQPNLPELSGIVPFPAPNKSQTVPKVVKKREKKPVEDPVPVETKPVDPSKLEYMRLHKKKLREAAIIRFKQKREERKLGVKKVRYQCRKQIADSRPRVKGRFVSKEKQASPSLAAIDYLAKATFED
ncbi:hypothetical protein NDN08_007863 [Rhodosorus marinus]|uniref:CCT domain-containing protein n=1 Tax=Rhodosorus marinus TaxID=101924 RepID=A0AAV8UYS0_9RHOD|nr:hypothetical protein NDN08_007863 [Rhodosorus marinus]